MLRSTAVLEIKNLYRRTELDFPDAPRPVLSGPGEHALQMMWRFPGDTELTGVPFKKKGRCYILTRGGFLIFPESHMAHAGRIPELPAPLEKRVAELSAASDTLSEVRKYPVRIKGGSGFEFKAFVEGRHTDHHRIAITLGYSWRPSCLSRWSDAVVSLSFTLHARDSSRACGDGVHRFSFTSAPRSEMTSRVVWPRLRPPDIFSPKVNIREMSVSSSGLCALYCAASKTLDFLSGGACFMLSGYGVGGAWWDPGAALRDDASDLANALDLKICEMALDIVCHTYSMRSVSVTRGEMTEDGFQVSRWVEGKNSGDFSLMTALVSLKFDEDDSPALAIDILSGAERCPPDVAVSGRTADLFEGGVTARRGLEEALRCFKRKLLERKLTKEEARGEQ